MINTTIDGSADEQYYCHICNGNVATSLTSSQEWSCVVCSSTFVERLGQDIESFLSITTSDTSSSNSSNSNTSSNRSPLNNRNAAVQPSPTPSLSHFATRLQRRADIHPMRMQRVERERPSEREQPLLFRRGLMDILNSSIDNNPNPNTTTTNASDNEHGSLLVRQVSAPHELEAITSLLLASMQSQAHNQLPTNRPIPLFQIPRNAAFGGNDHHHNHHHHHHHAFREFAEGIVGNIGTFAGSMNSISFDDILHHILMHESSHAGRPPASEALLDSLCRIVVTDDNVNDMGECNITLEQFEVGDVAVKLTCGHTYKEDSIIHWLKMHNVCPSCRCVPSDESIKQNDDGDGDDDNDDDNDNQSVPPLCGSDSDSSAPMLCSRSDSSDSDSEDSD